MVVCPEFHDPSLKRPNRSDDALDEVNEPVMVGGYILGLCMQTN
jgi:hypothetical protein